MTLPAPRLDDRTFQSIVDEAKKRIPHYCGEWTDHNVSDPGVTLIELFAWMTDLLLYRMNQVPDLHYIKFMEMFGVRLQPPTAAQTEVTFWLSAAQPTAVTIPARTRVATTQTETQHSVSFVTDAEFTITVPDLALMFREISYPAGQRHFLPADLRQLRLRPGPDQNKGQHIFSPEPQPEDALYFGFRNDLSQLLLRIEWSFKSASGVGIEPENAPLVWEVANKEGGWTCCDIDEDTTQGLNRPDGYTQLHLPAMALRDVNGERFFWLRLRVRQPTQAELDRTYRHSPFLQHLGPVVAVGCTVPATHCELVTNELLGRSDGSPGQRFQLQGAPVLPRQAGETLLVFSGDSAAPAPEIWREVTDFADSQAPEPHFMLDSTNGEVRLAPALRQPDGSVCLYGRVPPRGASLVFARYRFGGGVEGNLEARRLNTLKTAIPFVRRVLNRREAKGGYDAETLERAMLRMPQLLRTRDCAVTAADFRALAQEAAPAGVGRVECLAPAAGDPGKVTVLIVPRLEQPARRLGPDELALGDAVRKQVEAYLDERRLLTTRIEVRTPRYVWAAVDVKMTPAPGADRAAVQASVLERLRRLINPLTGGPDGEGWPIGRSLYVGDVYQALLGLPGVQFVRNIDLFAAEPNGAPGGQPLLELPVSVDGVLVSGQHSIAFVEGEKQR